MLSPSLAGKSLYKLTYFSYDDEARLLLRYLQGLNWKYDMVHKIINEHNDWCNVNMPFSIKPIEDFLTKGITYIYKRDRGHRPILIINVDRLISSGTDVDTLIYLANFQLDYVLRNCLIPG